MKQNMTSLSHLAGMIVKVDREHYPLIIAVRLNPYQYVYKRSKYCPSWGSNPLPQAYESCLLATTL